MRTTSKAAFLLLVAILAAYPTMVLISYFKKSQLCEDIAYHWRLAFVYHGRVPASQCSCLANLKQMNGAKATWAMEGKHTSSETPTDSDLFGDTLYIRCKPVCPQGGKYSLGSISENVRCGVPGHTL
jgi:hypothetical protein